MKIYKLLCDEGVVTVEVRDGRVQSIITAAGYPMLDFQQVLFVGDAVDDVLHLAELVHGQATAAYAGEMK